MQKPIIIHILLYFKKNQPSNWGSRNELYIVIANDVVNSMAC